MSLREKIIRVLCDHSGKFRPPAECTADAILAAIASEPARAEQPDTDQNAPWLTLAHMICADAGIPPGHITDRLTALRERLSAEKPTQSFVGRVEARFNELLLTMPHELVSTLLRQAITESLAEQGALAEQPQEAVAYRFTPAERENLERACRLLYGNVLYSPSARNQDACKEAMDGIEKILAAPPAVAEPDAQARIDAQEGMAECMRMFRADMIEAGVIGESVPPMFMTEAILGEIGRLRAQLAAAQEALHWLEENGSSQGGGHGFTFTVFVPVDTECLLDGITRAIAAANGANHG
jgi:hypothetical protein